MHSARISSNNSTLKQESTTSRARKAVRETAHNVSCHAVHSIVAYLQPVRLLHDCSITNVISACLVGAR